MSAVYNFFLCSRLNTDSSLERRADLLMTPLRELLPGKQVAVFFNATMHVSDQKFGRLSLPSPKGWEKVALKIIFFVALPFAVVGILIKLICLKDAGFRAFCAQKVPANSTCHPKLSEMFQHLHYTSEFANDHPTELGTVVFKPLNLSECSCEGTGAFHRLRAPRRDNLENAIVRRLSETKPDKTQPLHLLSMGSGGLMSDFFTLEKLVLAGFKNISIDCVDPAGIDPARVESIQKFFSDYPDATIQIQAHRTIDAVPADRTGYSALLAVDYDSLGSFDFDKQLSSAGDLMKAHRRLGADGFMGLGYSDEDTLSGPRTPLTYVRSNSSAIFNLTDDMIQQLPRKEELTIGISSLSFANASNILLLALSMAAEKSGKDYRRISVSALTQRNKDKKPDFQAMMQSLFPRAVIEVSFHEEQNKLCDVLFTGTPEDEFRSKSYLSVLQPQALTYILELRGGMQRQNNNREDQRVQVRPCH